MKESVKNDVGKKVKQLIKSYISHWANLEASLYSTLGNDLGFDSLDCVELIIDLEIEFDISISDEDMHEKVGSDWKKATVQQIIDLTIEKINGE